MSNIINGVPADSRPVPKTVTKSGERDFVAFVCLPDHVAAFVLLDRAELEETAQAYSVKAGLRDPDELAGEEIEEAVRSYLHFGDSDKTMDAVVPLGFSLLSFEMGDASFAETDFAIIGYEHASGDMVVTPYESEEAFDAAVESLSVKCEAYEELGLPVPAPKYRPSSPVVLH